MTRLLPSLVVFLQWGEGMASAARHMWQPAEPRSSFCATRRRSTRHRVSVSTGASPRFPLCVPAQFAAEITEQAALTMAASIEVLPVRLSDGATLDTAVVRTTAAREHATGTPLVLLHGFDSSLLEFRRLLPLLENAGVPAIAVDLVGCGFTGLQHAQSAAPDDRRDHLRAFLEQYAGSTQVDLLGASLGGTCAIDFALAHPRLVRQIILVDAQGFVEGTPQLPGLLADVGIGVLRAIWLRSMANVMAYSDTKKFATDDAMRVGRLHTHLSDWSRSTRSFMDSGGFRVANRVREVHKRTLVVWGVDDEIISASVASRFAEELPNCEICYFPECGHVAHLERPHALRDAILRFRAENS